MEAMIFVNAHESVLESAVCSVIWEAFTRMVCAMMCLKMVVKME